MDNMGFQVPGLPPQLMNQPPQVFGGFGQGLPPDVSAHMFSDGMFGEDPNEAKRRRIAKACDMCRKKKIKCDGRMPSCSHCENYKTECTFTQVEKKRAPPKGAKYIEGLENRLGRMEHLLQLSGLLDDADGSTDLGDLEKKLLEKAQQRSRQASIQVDSSTTSPSQTTPAHEAARPSSQGSFTSPEPTRDREKEERRKSFTPADEPAGNEEVEALSQLMCSLVTNQSGESRYIGSSSGFSIFSPKGIQWVNEKTGDTSFQSMISDVSVDDHKWTNWKPDVFGDLFQRPIYRPLPPKNEALSLLTDFFENFNCMFPLFHQPTFMHLVERQYSSDPYQGSGWWASLNIAMAIAHHLRVVSNCVPQQDDEKAWDYFKNAMGVFSELTMRNADLLSVQAILGMALFMQGTPNPQPAFLLVAAALRLSHGIGLHKKATGFNLNPIEIEQRKRVFWIAYMLDKDMSLRAGRPPAQDDDDMNVELPEEDPEDQIGNVPLADGKGKVNLFRLMCEFTVIECQVYKRLYSTKATKQSDGELLNAIGELDQQLEEWKDKIPIDFRPEHEIKASHTPLILHVVMLHFTYYNCLTTIHRMSIHHGFWTSRLSNYALQGLNAKALNPRVYSSAALCTAAARASISLLKYIPQGDFSCVWMVLYFPVSSLVTLFGNILQNPLDRHARSDVRLMSLVVTFLSMLGQEAEQGGVHRMLAICAEFERIAKLVIERAEKDPSSRRKRKNPDGTTVKASLSPSMQGVSMTGAAMSRSPLIAGASQPNTAPSTAAGVHDLLSPFAKTEPTTFQAPSSRAMSETSPPMDGPPVWAQDFAAINAMNGTDFGASQFLDMNGGVGFPGDMQSPQGFPGNLFQQQPLLPQDLFALPMTLDWNWAEMSGGAYPSVENGNYGEGQHEQYAPHQPQ